MEDVPITLPRGLAEVVDRMPMGIAVFGTDLRLIERNGTWTRFAERFSPLSADKVTPGTHLFELVPQAAEWGPALLERVRAGETVMEDDLRIERDGVVSYWNVILSPLIDDRQFMGFVMVSADATERVHALQELGRGVEERTRELERRRQVADGLHDIMDILNSERALDEVLDYIIAEANRLLGSEAVSVTKVDVCCGVLRFQTSYGMEDDTIAQLEIPTGGQGVVAATIVKRRPMVVGDVRVLMDNARREMPPAQQALLARVFERYRAVMAVPIVVQDELYGALTMFYPQTREFSEQDVALASDLADHLALAIENARLREQARDSAVAAERSRLARDLHDAVTQTLFSASLIAEVLPRLWDKDENEARRRLEELRALTKGALAEMRTLLVELRPTALEEADLAELLRQLAEATTGRARIPVELAVEGEPAPLPSDVQVALYRIAQEALNNVARHSSATSATVGLNRRPGRVELSIQDDGCGFAVADSGGGEHLGVGIMRERAEAIGADLQMDSHPGEGCRVSVVWESAQEANP